MACESKMKEPTEFNGSTQLLSIIFQHLKSSEQLVSEFKSPRSNYYNLLAQFVIKFDEQITHLIQNPATVLKVPNLNMVDNVQRLAAESLMTFSDDLKIGRKIHLYG